MAKIGDTIKYYRTKKGLKQSELAQLLGKAPSVIANWEAGTNLPNAPAIETMCSIFEIDANTLFGWENVGTTELAQSREAVTVGRAYDRAPEHIQRSIRAMLEPYMTETAVEIVPASSAPPEYDHLTKAEKLAIIAQQLDLEEEASSRYSSGSSGAA